jgi:hypothetical protein
MVQKHDTEHRWNSCLISAIAVTRQRLTVRHFLCRTKFVYKMVCQHWTFIFVNPTSSHALISLNDFHTVFERPALEQKIYRWVSRMKKYYSQLMWYPAGQNACYMHPYILTRRRVLAYSKWTLLKCSKCMSAFYKFMAVISFTSWSIARFVAINHELLHQHR